MRLLLWKIELILIIYHFLSRLQGLQFILLLLLLRIHIRIILLKRTSLLNNTIHSFNTKFITIFLLQSLRLRKQLIIILHRLLLLNLLLLLGTHIIRIWLWLLLLLLLLLNLLLSIWKRSSNRVFHRRSERLNRHFLISFKIFNLFFQIYKIRSFMNIIFKHNSQNSIYLIR